MFSFLDALTTEAVAQSLQAELPAVFDSSEEDASAIAGRAAVLIPFIRKAGAWEIVYIRRAICERDRHSGQIAFPGGMWSSVDRSMTDTALREAEEEIGLARHDVALLGQLPCHHSIGGIKITPVVAAIPWPYPFQPDHSEVAKVFSIPLAWLANPVHFEVRKKNGGKPIKTVYYKPYEGENLWGATARMTLSLISALTHTVHASLRH